MFAKHSYTKIIQGAGKTCVVEEIVPGIFPAELMKKWGDEFEVFTQTPSAEALADTLEVQMAIAEYQGISWDEVERFRAEKAEARGAFERRLVSKRGVRQISTAA